MSHNTNEQYRGCQISTTIVGADGDPEVTIAVTIKGSQESPFLRHTSTSVLPGAMSDQAEQLALGWAHRWIDDVFRPPMAG